MGYVSKEYLKENGYILFRYQKSADGSEGVLPVNIDDLPEGYKMGCITMQRKVACFGSWVLAFQTICRVQGGNDGTR